MAKEKDHIVVFKQEGCPPCEELSMYIEQKGIECTFITVYEEISEEVLTKMYPDCPGFPFVTINHEPIGDLMLYLEGGFNA